MTNERAQRIVDLPADTTADSIAPPPVDRADQESQLDESPALNEAAPSAEIATADAPEELSEAGEGEPRADLEELADPDELAEGDDEGDAPIAETDVEVAVASDDATTADESDDEEDDDGEPTEALPQLLEALLFVADEPIAPSALGRALERTPRQVRRGLDDLADTLREQKRGVRLQQGPDGAQLVTAPEAANTVEVFLGLEANRRLSNAALETLAIIAYRQPVTRHVIEQIRGVSSDGAVATLRARGLIEGIGRAPGPGRPLLFATTQRFLEHFGLERPDELPPLPDDVELPPEEGGAQLPLTDVEAGVEGGETTATLDGDAVGGDEAVAEAAVDQAQLSEDEPVGDDLEDDDEVIEDTIDTDDDFAPFEDDAALDDEELEISDDLGDLSRAAGAALSTTPEPTDDPSSPTPPWSPSASS